MWTFRVVAFLVCGRFGLWSFRFVAFPVCGHSGLWPFRFVAVSVVAVSGVAVSVCGCYDLLPLDTYAFNPLVFSLPFHLNCKYTTISLL